jgi:hypothetical protein
VVTRKKKRLQAGAAAAVLKWIGRQRTEKVGSQRDKYSSFAGGDRLIDV